MTARGLRCYMTRTNPKDEGGGCRGRGGGGGRGPLAFTLDCKTVRIFADSSTREQSNKRCGT